MDHDKTEHPARNGKDKDAEAETSQARLVDGEETDLPGTEHLRWGY